MAAIVALGTHRGSTASPHRSPAATTRCHPAAPARLARSRPCRRLRLRHLHIVKVAQGVEGWLASTCAGGFGGGVVVLDENRAAGSQSDMRGICCACSPAAAQLAISSCWLPHCPPTSAVAAICCGALLPVLPPSLLPSTPLLLLLLLLLLLCSIDTILQSCRPILCANCSVHPRWHPARRRRLRRRCRRLCGMCRPRAAAISLSSMPHAAVITHFAIPA